MKDLSYWKAHSVSIRNAMEACWDDKELELYSQFFKAYSFAQDKIEAIESQILVNKS